MSGFMGYAGFADGEAYAAASTVAKPKAYPATLIGTTDVAPLVELLQTLPTGSPIAVDTETTGLYPFEHDVLRGVSIAFRTDVGDATWRHRDGSVRVDHMDAREGDYYGLSENPDTDTVSANVDICGRLHSFYIPVGYPYPQGLSEYDIRKVFDAFVAVEPFLVLHNGKFDFAFLRQLPTAQDSSVYFAFPRAGDWWDTQVVAWLLDENLPKALKKQAARLWGDDEKAEQTAVKALVKERGGWDMLTPEDTATYAAKDAEQTLRLYEYQLNYVDGHPSVLGNVRPAIERELEVQAVLSRVERTGILVDAQRIEVMRDETELEVDRIAAQFLAIEYVADSTLGRNIDADLYSIPKKGVNINSPRQLAAYLYDGLGLDCPHATKGGARSTDRAAIESLPETPETIELLKYGRLKKALTGYLRPLLERIGHDGRIHPSFNSTGTVTGRFSCSAPNLQTIPRGDTLVGVRDVFIAEDGFELWEYDLQAAEMRVMAGMAQQRNMIEALESGADVHGALAVQVFGEGYTGLQRRYCKNIGYGWNYGLTSPVTAAKYIGGPDAQKLAKQILKGLAARYPQVVELMNATTARAIEEGYVPIHETAWPGRFRRIATTADIKPYAYTALNAQIQGGIGELMKDVMCCAERCLGQNGARICLQVHDSLVIEVQEGDGELVLSHLQHILDELNPFAMPMFFDGKPWAQHD